LQEQLAQGSLSEQQQKELAEQLKAMKDSLAKSAEAQKKMLAELQRQLEQAKQAGNQQGAKDLQSQINRLQAQQPERAMMEGMAAMMQKAAEAMEKGNNQQAQNALNQMQGELTTIQQQMTEMQMLTMTLDDIQGAKMAMSGQDQKDGGPGTAEDQKQKIASDRGVGDEPGGEGTLPDPLKNPKLYDSRVRQDVAKGAVVVTGTIAGPNAKGQALEVIKSEVEAAKNDASDPLTDQRLPRSQREHVQQYFDAFRKGQ
jgi:chromosome segregation ATPase